MDWLTIGLALAGFGCLCCCVNMCAAAREARKPWPECPGRVVGVHGLTEWKAVLASARSKSALVVVDCYALWCPPCKRAAPTYGRMSLEYDPETVMFAKVDVDAASDVARLLGVSAMPTFFCLRDGEVIDSVTGWRESSVRRMLDESGAKLLPAADEGDEVAGGDDESSRLV